MRCPILDSRRCSSRWTRSRWRSNGSARRNASTPSSRPSRTSHRGDTRSTGRDLTRRMSGRDASSRDDVTLVWPTLERVPAYVAALERGWSPDTLRAEAAQEELAHIAADPAAFIAEQVDREGAGPPVTLPDGTKAARLPGYRRWIWDGDFCGVIGFRWARGTEELPPHVLGHIG